MARWGLRGCAPTVLPGCMWRIVRLSACEIDTEPHNRSESTQEPEFRETARSGHSARAQRLGHEDYEDEGQRRDGRPEGKGPFEAVEVEQQSA